MDSMFAPWRIKYIQNGIKEEGCIFCNRINQDVTKDKNNFIIKRTNLSFVIMNAYPYNNGHLMIVPKRHVANIEELTQEEIVDLMTLTQEMVSVLKNVYNPEGLNIGINLGKCAGAGVADHLHIHIVPRWNGDTNFMTVIAETRVIPEDFNLTYEKIKGKCNE